MFCGECGAKNKKGAKFCEECGAKLETKEEKVTEKEEVKEEKPVVKKERKPISKKQKVLITILAIVVVVLFGGYKYLENETSPKKIVENYLKAVNSANYKKIYKYSNYEGDKTFITQKRFVELMKEQNKDSKVGNYVVGEVNYENGNLNATVTVNTTEKKQMTVKLEKGMEKKYFIFDNWKITDASDFGLKTVNNYKIKVPKGTKLTYDGIKVSDKYIVKEKKDKDKDDTKLVVYELPQVFSIKTKANAKYATSEKEFEVNPTVYNNVYTLILDEDDFNKDDTKAILDKSKKIIQALMNGIKDGKDFKDVKEANTLDETTKEYYDKKATSYSRYNRKLEAFEITDSEVKDISCDDGFIKARVSVTYKYSTNQLKDKSTSSTVYVYFSYDKDFVVERVTTLPYAGVY